MKTPAKIFEAFKEKLEDENADFNGECEAFAPYVRNMLIDQPELFNASLWRSHTLSRTKKRDGETASHEFLLIVRAVDIEKQPVVAFIPCSSGDQGWIDFCYRAANAELKWKDDQPASRSGSGKPSFMDAVGGTGK